MKKKNDKNQIDDRFIHSYLKIEKNNNASGY